jgi:hypothetical protein
MNEEEVKARAQRFMDTFGDFLDKYEEANPEWMRIGLLQILYGAIENLKRVIEDPEEKEITWEAPLTELRYDVQADWEKVEPLYFRLTSADLEDPERLQKAFVKGFMTVKEVYILRQLTREILVILKGGKVFYKVPLSLDKKLDKLPKKDRTRRIERILKPVTKITKFAYDLPPVGKKRARVYLAFQFNPCVLNVDEKRAYFPIIIGLDFRGIRPEDIDAETRAEFLKALLQGAEEAIPKEDLDFLKRPRPEPEARPVTKETPLVKAGLHTELQKFGHKPDPRQPGLFDRLLDETKKEIEKRDVDVIGIDITPAQEQALFGLQALLTRTNYKGNLPGEMIDDRGFKFKGHLPALEFTPAQYLEACGLKKRLTGRGKEEYDGKDRAEALQALVDLAKKLFLFVYKREYWVENPLTKKKELRIDRIETIAPLIKIIRGWEALTKKEDALLDKGTHTGATDEKLKAIAIEPAPIIVQDKDSYFVLKPANYLQEISMKYPWPHRPSKFTLGLINWLIAQAELKRRHRQPLIIEQSLETIAYALRMDAWIKTRQLKRIKQILTKGYKIAQELGYLLSYGTVRGQTKDLERLELNPEKFSRARGTMGDPGQVEDQEIVH